MISIKLNNIKIEKENKSMISFILIANDYYKFGEFKDTNECVISITKEIFNKMFKAVLNEM